MKKTMVYLCLLVSSFALQALDTEQYDGSTSYQNSFKVDTRWCVQAAKKVLPCLLFASAAAQQSSAAQESLSPAGTAVVAVGGILTVIGVAGLSWVVYRCITYDQRQQEKRAVNAHRMHTITHVTPYTGKRSVAQSGALAPMPVAQNAQRIPQTFQKNPQSAQAKLVTSRSVARAAYDLNDIAVLPIAPSEQEITVHIIEQPHIRVQHGEHHPITPVHGHGDHQPVIATVHHGTYDNHHPHVCHDANQTIDTNNAMPNDMNG